SGSCSKDFLNAQSPSSVAQEVAFSSPSDAFKVIAESYDFWRDANNSLFYDIDVVGSDSEHHPEPYDAQTRHIPEGLYASELTIDFSDAVNTWENLYRIANRANIIMESIAKNPEYQNAVSKGEV